MGSEDFWALLDPFGVFMAHSNFFRSPRLLPTSLLSWSSLLQSLLRSIYFWIHLFFSFSLNVCLSVILLSVSHRILHLLSPYRHSLFFFGSIFWILFSGLSSLFPLRCRLPSPRTGSTKIISFVSYSLPVIHVFFHPHLAITTSE
ncbi:hypothetical protein ABW19_dt0202671 [Dactylella cylindrospora]|nr:hypothetical protein ABW19_dt0202671 [Dactylella cylindrospora]